MSDRPIQVGDLVVVVKSRSCCGSAKGIGKIYTVSGFTSEAHCECGAILKGNFALNESGYMRCQVERLKRIDPDCLKDEIPTGEKLEA